MEALLAEAAADSVGGVEREGALVLEEETHGVAERAGRHRLQQATGEAHPGMGLHDLILAEGLQEAAGGVERLEAFGFAFLAVLRHVLIAAGHRLEPAVDGLLLAHHLEAGLEAIEGAVGAVAGVVLAEGPLVVVVRGRAQHGAGLLAAGDHLEGALRGLDLDLDDVEEFVQVTGHHVLDGFAFGEERDAIGEGDAEAGGGVGGRVERAHDDREAVLLVEDQLGHVEERVSHRALLHRAAQEFEFLVVREEGDLDDRAEGRLILPAGWAAVVAARTIPTGAAVVAAGAVTGRAFTVAAAKTGTIAAVLAPGAPATADLLGGAVDPGRAETKRGQSQIEGRVLGRRVLGRFGRHRKLSVWKDVGLASVGMSGFFLHPPSGVPPCTFPFAQVVEWQTRMLEVHVPQGVRVQVPA